MHIMRVKSSKGSGCSSGRMSERYPLTHCKGSFFLFLYLLNHLKNLTHDFLCRDEHDRIERNRSKSPENMIARKRSGYSMTANALMKHRKHINKSEYSSSKHSQRSSGNKSMAVNEKFDHNTDYTDDNLKRESIKRRIKAVINNR